MDTIVFFPEYYRSIEASSIGCECCCLLFTIVLLILEYMRIPLTKYGWPQVALYPAVLILMMVVYFVIARLYLSPKCHCALSRTWLWLPEVLFLVVLVWVFSFFRDPQRSIVQDPSLLLSPADGTVTAVETLPNCEGFDGPVWRCEIFLSIFNVHVNRVPCPVKIGQVTYKPGKFLDARNPQAAKVNESNNIEMFRLDAPKDRLVVRQISGAIARRIVCQARAGEEYSGGQPFGMIKFGSGTELYVPVNETLKPCVQKGDKVKAGLTVLARYE